MKNVLSYINRPLFGVEIKSWIAENIKQNTEYSRIARSMLRYMNLRDDRLYIIVTSPPGSASGKRNTGKPIVVEQKKGCHYEDNKDFSSCFVRAATESTG